MECRTVQYMVVQIVEGSTIQNSTGQYISGQGNKKDDNKVEYMTVQ